MKTNSLESSERYDVVRQIGRGGMGTVYEVIDTVRDHRVALKTISEIDARGVTHLKREFRTVSELRHPYLTTLFDLVADEESCFFTMELVAGADLRSWIRPKDVHSELVFANTVAPLDPQLFIDNPDAPRIPDSLADENHKAHAIRFDETRLRKCIAQLAEALGFLHDHGKVHRDVKPSNIMVTADGSLKLLDFGLAFDWADPISGVQKHSGPLAGTVPYMAPEYLDGGKVSPAIDMYAVGILAYELVTGDTPFRGSFSKVIQAHINEVPSSPKLANPAVPDDLDQLIMDLLTKDPENRPTAFEVRARTLGKAVTARIKQRRSRPRFVGRDAETELLQLGLASASAGTPHLVLVGGPSGVGMAGSSLLGNTKLDLFRYHIVHIDRLDLKTIVFKVADPLFAASTGRGFVNCYLILGKYRSRKKQDKQAGENLLHGFFSFHLLDVNKNHSQLYPVFSGKTGYFPQDCTHL